MGYGSDIEYKENTAKTVSQETVSPEMPERDLSWSEVYDQASENLSDSGVQALKDLIEPFLSPVETGKALGNLALGTAQKLIPGEQEEERYADAVGNFISKRYGGIENFKRTLAKDPVGTLADASMVFSGGGAIVGKLGKIGRKAAIVGKLGKIGRKAAAGASLVQKTGEAIQKAADIVDPLNLVRTVTSAGPLKGLSRLPAELIGMTTGFGGEPIKAAFQAGRQGGEQSKIFKENLRGEVDLVDVLDDVEVAKEAMHKARSKDYTEGMTPLKAKKDVLMFAPIDNVLNEAFDRVSYKGKIIDETGAKALEDVKALVDDWKISDPKQFHTIEGLDALKQAIGKKLKTFDKGTNEYGAVKQVFDATRRQIIKLDPDYGKIMKDYENATKVINEIGRTLSLGGKSTQDTKLRKLLSTQRSGSGTNYGQRVKLIEQLDDYGGGRIMPAVSGQALASWMPQGMQRALKGASISTGQPTLVGLLGRAASATGNIPRQILASPRIMGELAFGLGRGAGAVEKITPKALLDLGKILSTPVTTKRGLYASGRLEDAYDEYDFTRNRGIR
jgi:hypothetical protein